MGGGYSTQPFYHMAPRQTMPYPTSDFGFNDGQQAGAEVRETLGEPLHHSVFETRIVGEDRASRATVFYQGAGEGLAGVHAGKVKAPANY